MTIHAAVRQVSAINTKKAELPKAWSVGNKWISWTWRRKLWFGNDGGSGHFLSATKTVTVPLVVCQRRKVHQFHSNKEEKHNTMQVWFRQTNMGTCRRFWGNKTVVPLHEHIGMLWFDGLALRLFWQGLNFTL